MSTLFVKQLGRRLAFCFEPLSLHQPLANDDSGEDAKENPLADPSPNCSRVHNWNIP